MDEDAAYLKACMERGGVKGVLRLSFLIEKMGGYWGKGDT